MINKKFLCIIAASTIIASGCSTREDKLFPQFEPVIPIVLRKSGENISICEINSQNQAKDFYNQLQNNYSGDWERSNFTSYAADYVINTGDTKIMVIKGGIVITSPRTNYITTNKGKITFVKWLPAGESSKIIGYICR